MARRLGWSQSRISRLLNGKRGGTECDVVAVMALCGMVGEERDEAIEACRAADISAGAARFGAVVPKSLGTIVDDEQEAIRINQYEVVIVPLLLQTADYARAMLRAQAKTDDEIDAAVRERQSRQRVFGEAKHFTFYVHEFALRTPIGERWVMSDQLHQLHQLLRLSVRPEVTIRVLPANLGVVGGPFQVLEYLEARPVAFIEGETVGVFLEELPEIEAYQAILARLSVLALSDARSRKMIAWLATALYAPTEPKDE